MNIKHTEKKVIFENDIFYNITNLSLEKIRELLEEAHNLSYYWHVDVLKKVKRELEIMPFEKIMEKCVKESFFVFIFRRGYSSWTWFLEIGFRTMTNPDYFLFIDVDPKHLNYLVDKFGLKAL